MNTPDRPSARRMVTDPHDHRERPFCASIGRLFAYAMQNNRYCAPTREEDVLWRAAGQALIDQTQAARRTPAGPALPDRSKRMPA